MTLPLGRNYGGIMQAWALQQVLKRLGHEPVTIDRQSVTRSTAYRYVSLTYRAAMKLAGKREAPINFERHLPYILQRTQSFIKQHIEMSEPLGSTAKIKQHFEHNNYDCVLVGSDQTWRPQYSPNIYNFYLDFIDDNTKRCVAYATSFGVDSWEYSSRQTAICRKLVKKFYKVSVRETSGVLLCRENLSIDADQVLDPTLLLSSDEYINFTLNGDYEKRGGIFSYILDASPGKERFVSEIATSLGAEIFRHQSSMSLERLESQRIDDYIYPSVEGWVHSFDKADYVITDSFHGCVFSIIFNKRFVAVGNNKRGLDRFKSLLKQFNLEDRLIEPCASMGAQVLTKSIDWERVNKLLDKERERSISFIKCSLSS